MLFVSFAIYILFIDKANLLLGFIVAIVNFLLAKLLLKFLFLMEKHCDSNNCPNNNISPNKNSTNKIQKIVEVMSK